MKFRICLLTKLVLLCGLFAAVAVAAVAQTTVDTLFQLDGNAATDSPALQCSYLVGGTPTTAGCDSWTSLIGTNTATRVDHDVAHSLVSAFVNGTDSTDSYTGGGSKDPNPLSQWAWSGSPTPNKDTLNDGYAAMYAGTSNNDFALMFGANRASPNGDANIGIWFFQGAVSLNPNGSFNGSHQDGDVFVISAFTGGGGTSGIEVLQWDSSCSRGVKNPGAGACADTNLRLIVNQGTTASCTGQLYCAVTNSSTTTSSWDGNLIMPTFFEGGINLSALFGNKLPCFASFLEETRSSQSTSAVLKDFVIGGLPSCGLSITKSCGTGLQAPQIVNNGTQVLYTWTGSVTNTGIGTLSNVQVDDTFNKVLSHPTLYDASNNPITSLAAGASGSYTFQATVAALTASNTATAEAAGIDPASVTPATAGCTENVSTSISVTKSCVAPGPLVACSSAGCVVRVPFKAHVCNLSNVQVTNVSLSDDPATIAPLASIPLLNPVPASALDTSNCADVYGTIQPTSDSGDGATNGRYTFTDTVSVTSATPALGPPLSPTTSTLCPAGSLACSQVACPLCSSGECTN